MGWALTERDALPGLRALAFALAALVALGGLGLAVWGLPVPQPLGRPRVTRDVPVTPADLGAGLASSSPTVAVDPTDPRFVAVAHETNQPGGGCGLQVSGDEGASWTGAQAVFRLPEGDDRCSLPGVAFDRTGTLYYLFTGRGPTSGMTAGVYLIKSTDRARTFGDPVRVVGPGGSSARVAGDLSVAGSRRIRLTWIQAQSGQVMTMQSGDGGRTFSSPIAVSPPGRAERAAPALAMSPDGQATIAWYDLGIDPGAEPAGRSARRWLLMASSAYDSEDSFRPSEVIDRAVAPPGIPASILDVPPPALVASRDRVCAAWTDRRFGDPDVLLRCRSKEGLWGPAERVNDDRRGSGYWQYLPQLAVAPNGRIDVAFYDRRDNLRNRLTGLDFAYSYDGRSFSGNIAVSKVAFDAVEGDIDPGSGVAMWGDNTSSLVVWADSRNRTSSLVGQDLFAAKADSLLAAFRPRWALPAGLVGLAVGSVGMWRLRRRPKQGGAA